MAQTVKKLRSIKGKVMRITRLDDCGNLITGPNAFVVSEGFIKVTWAPEVEKGEEYTQKNAWGDFCISEKDPDRVKWINTTIQLCEIDPAILDIIGGADPLTGPATLPATLSLKALTSNVATITTAAPHGYVVGDLVTVVNTTPDPVFDGVQLITAVTSTTFNFTKVNANVTSGAAVGTVTKVGDYVGNSYDTAANPLAFAIEVWTKKAGVDHCVPGAVEWGYFVAPYVRNGQPDGDTAVENAALSITLKGEAGNAPATWYQGPYGDNPIMDPRGFPAGALRAQVTTTVQPPTATVGTGWLPARGQATPGNQYGADPDITASDAPNAAKLTTEGFVAVPQTNWTTGQKIQIGAYAFNWSGAAWAAGAHA